MARTAQRLAIIAAITASIMAYLWRAPNSEGIEQLDRIRALTASMKVTYLIGRAAEMLGISDRISIVRKIGGITRLLKDAQDDAGLEIQDTLIENVPVRIARPKNQNGNLPAIVFYHGGAFYMGSVDTHNSLTSGLARLANVVVVSVDYRLAPEHPFPAGLEDCYTVTKHILENGNSNKFRIDTNRVAVAGDSAGGNFAAVIAMRFASQTTSERKPRLQILIYPVLQLFDIMLPSYMHSHFEFFPYTVDHTLSTYFGTKVDQSIYANNHLSVAQKKQYRKYVDWSLIPEKYRTVYQKPLTDNQEGDPTLIENAKLALNPEVSPLLVDDESLAKLPSTYLLTVGHDRLRDETFIYEGRLKRNGVPVVHNHYEHIFHGSAGFINGPFALDIAKKMVDDMVKYIGENL
ncbi:unnamed protein product [Adineta ricciae]|uniref:Alpha/beta hydrolase fold-3 domain-containing protein n=1 Tax=Adineta ricciae TaxID=249248 RepID=A0A813ZU36_ADIRI|nr:unnamed protein product [Adineta ricciae]CAF0931633.1 unnamed protein product [Adineta ricciae]